MAKSYNNLFGLKSTGLRFFTVYGAWGRPDMAYYIFAEKILQNKKIKVFNYGKMERDFTYIDDIVFGIIMAIKENYNCEIFNLGNDKTVKVLDMVRIIEKNVGKKAKIEYLPMQLGDVEKTHADINKAKSMISYDPKTDFEQGFEMFIDWFLKYRPI